MDRQRVINKSKSNLKKLKGEGDIRCVWARRHKVVFLGDGHNQGDWNEALQPVGTLPQDGFLQVSTLKTGLIGIVPSNFDEKAQFEEMMELISPGITIQYKGRQQAKEIFMDENGDIGTTTR
jgi:hypothetical protein